MSNYGEFNGSVLKIETTVIDLRHDRCDTEEYVSYIRTVKYVMTGH